MLIHEPFYDVMVGAHSNKNFYHLPD